jgi:hypothetical protein
MSPHDPALAGREPAQRHLRKEEVDGLRVGFKNQKARMRNTFSHFRCYNNGLAICENFTRAKIASANLFEKAVFPIFLQHFSAKLAAPAAGLVSCQRATTSKVKWHDLFAFPWAVGRGVCQRISPQLIAVNTASMRF